MLFGPGDDIAYRRKDRHYLRRVDDYASLFSRRRRRRPGRRLYLTIKLQNSRQLPTDSNHQHPSICGVYICHPFTVLRLSSLQPRGGQECLLHNRCYFAPTRFPILIASAPVYPDISKANYTYVKQV